MVATKQDGLSLTTADDCPKVVHAGAAQLTRAWTLFATAALALVLGLWLHRHFFHDDAFICLRYAERFLAGKGWTWNDGEHVEGFSSPCWLAQLVLLGRLGIPLPYAARGLGIAYALATLTLWWRARARPEGLLALVTVPGWTMWAWGGLETLGACFWILAAMVAVARMQQGRTSLRETILVGVSFSAVALNRPEGVLVGLSLLGAACSARRQRPFLIGVASLALAFAAYEVFRLAYFGDWVANGARAKTLGLPLRARIEDAAIYVAKTAPQWLASVLMAGWFLFRSADRRGHAWLLLPCLPLLGVVFIGGGDHMPGARFMLAPVAVMCLAGSLAPPSPRRGTRRIAYLLTLICSLWQLHYSWRYPAALNPAAAVGEIVGRALEDKLPPGTLVATATAGSVPYFARSLSFVDTLGLNDPHIASKTPAALPKALDDSDNWFAVPGHARGDGDYVLSRRPDAIMLGGANGDIAPWFLGDYQMLMSKSFRDAYAPWRLFVPVSASMKPSLAEHLDAASGRLPITLYIRHDSPVWPLIAREAEALPPPWPADH